MSATTRRDKKTAKSRAANKRYWQSAKGKAIAARYRPTAKLRHQGFDLGTGQILAGPGN